jgi:hypothetical protein
MKKPPHEIVIDTMMRNLTLLHREVFYLMTQMNEIQDMLLIAQNKKLNKTDLENNRQAIFRAHSKEVREKLKEYGDEYNFDANNIL